jgi:hypothetical protein
MVNSIEDQPTQSVDLSGSINGWTLVTEAANRHWTRVEGSRTSVALHLTESIGH